MKVNRDHGDLLLKIPVNNAQTYGCLPIGSKIMQVSYAEIADRCALMVQY